jgi:hypothetical protein
MAPHDVAARGDRRFLSTSQLRVYRDQSAIQRVTLSLLALQAQTAPASIEIDSPSGVELQPVDCEAAVQPHRPRESGAARFARRHSEQKATRECL